MSYHVSRRVWVSVFESFVYIPRHIFGLADDAYSDLWPSCISLNACNVHVHICRGARLTQRLQDQGRKKCTKVDSKDAMFILV